MTEDDIRRRIVVAKASQLIISEIVSGSISRLERRFVLKLLEIFTRWNKKIAALLKDLGLLTRAAAVKQLIREMVQNPDEDGKLSKDMLTNMIAVIYDDVLDMPEYMELKQVWREHLVMTYTQGAVIALRTLGIPARPVFEVQKAADEVVMFELTDEEVMAALDERVVEHGRRVAAETIVTARNVVKDEIFTGLGNVDSAAKRIAAGAGMTEAQALRIARTETQAGFNMAMHEQYVRSGVPTRSWLTVGDRRVRDSHRTNEAEGPVAFGKPFPNGQMHPADGVDSINCRCSIVPHAGGMEICPDSPYAGMQAGPQMPRADGPRVFTNEDKADRWARGNVSDVDAYHGNQRDALERYRGGAYEEVNGNLRFGVDPLGESRYGEGVIEGVSKGLDDAFDAAKGLPEDLTVFRGMRVRGTKDYSTLVGKTFEDKAFMSTSMMPDVAKTFSDSDSVIVKLTVPKGTKGIYLGAEETEILLNRGSKIKFTSIGMDEKTQRMTLVGELAA